MLRHPRQRSVHEAASARDIVRAQALRRAGEHLIDFALCLLGRSRRCAFRLGFALRLLLRFDRALNVGLEGQCGGISGIAAQDRFDDDERFGVIRTREMTCGLPELRLELLAFALRGVGCGFAGLRRLAEIADFGRLRIQS
jgi:hypothetical protein